MSKNLTCSQVLSLINFYISDSLNATLKSYVEEHIANCPACKKKIEDLSKILGRYENVKTETTKDDLIFKNSESFSNLSAYVDNELNQNDNIRIKKLTISNAKVRKQLESMYKYQKLLNSAYERTKSGLKTDYAKAVVSQIVNGEDYTTLCFYRLFIIFCILIIAIISGFVYLYF